MALQTAVCLRTFWVAADSAADEQGDAGGHDVELADLLPRHAPHLLQRLVSPHGGCEVAGSAW